MTAAEAKVIADKVLNETEDRLYKEHRWSVRNNIEKAAKRGQLTLLYRTNNIGTRLRTELQADGFTLRGEVEENYGTTHDRLRISWEEIPCTRS